MNCENSPLLLHAYLDGELDPVHCIEIEGHLKSCAECAKKLVREQALRKAFRSADLYHRAPAGLEARVRASTSGGAAMVRPMPSARGAERTSRKPVMQWAAVAAILLLAALGIEFGLWLLRRQPNELVAQEVVASHIRSLQPGHLFDVQSTDQHTVKPWFDGRIDFAPPVRDFSDQGFSLVGGRLDYIGNRNVAVLVYQRRKHIINLFVWPEGAGSGAGNFLGHERSEMVNGYNVVQWKHAGMEFCAASDVNEADLQTLVQLLDQ